MATSTFRSEVAKGSGFEESITRQFVAADANVALYGPVILVASSEGVLPKVGSTTTAGDAKVIGVCVILPIQTVITANVSYVTVVMFGLCKLLVEDAAVAMNDVIETTTTAGKARVQPAAVITDDTVVTLGTSIQTIAQNIRKGFALALSTSSGANSIIAVFVNVNCSQAAYAIA